MFSPLEEDTSNSTYKNSTSLDPALYGRMINSFNYFVGMRITMINDNLIVNKDASSKKVLNYKRDDKYFNIDQNIKRELTD